MTDMRVPIDISIETADDRVTVVARDPHAEHTAAVRRSPDAEVLRHVPIGSRSAEHLTMLLDGRPVDLRPGPGKLTRGSYKVTAIHDGVEYLLKPASSTSSSLHRGGTRLGELSRSSDAEVKVWWEKGAEVSAADAAIGNALAAAFGTGAKFFLLALLEDGSAATPG